MTNKSYWIVLFSLGCLGIYLFVTAPPPLDDQKTQQATIAVDRCLLCCKPRTLPHG